MSFDCTRCGFSALLARDSAANGATQIFWWCIHCQAYADPRHPFVSHVYVERVLRFRIEDLAVIERYPAAPRPVCQRCSASGVEYHHWAPRHLFEDAELWPGGWLCPPCHQLWHSVVTPAMCASGRGAQA